MSRIVRLLQWVTLVAVIFAGVLDGNIARATDAPYGLSGTSGEQLGVERVGQSGAMTYSIPFELPANRGSAQPSLGLSYASGARTGDAGVGWSLDLPSIERAPLSGWPKYIDDGTLQNEDRYAFNGDPLTFICVVGSCPSTEAVGPTVGMPEVSGYRYYRRQIESGFERFFLSPDRSTWLVQLRGGGWLELGYPITRPDLVVSSPMDIDNSTPTPRAFRWNLAVQRDLHGDKNIVYYRWAHDGFNARKYLRDVYYTPPAVATSTAATSEFAYHVELRWETPGYRQEDVTFPDKRPHYRRLKRVAISAKRWSNAGEREMVRAYNLAYSDERSVPGTANDAPVWGRSFLKSVQLEGRCYEPVAESEGYLPPATGCPVMPSTTFFYQPAQLNSGTASRSTLPVTSFGGPDYITSTIVTDVDRDGLPDVVAAWPTNFYTAPDVTPEVTYEYLGPAGVGGGDCHGGTPNSTFRFRIRNEDPANPVLGCWKRDTEFENWAFHPWQSARIHNAWLNRGPTSAGGPLTLQHNCLDAAALITAQAAGPFWSADRQPSMFSQFGGQTLGDWGDQLLLWSPAKNAAFGIRPGQVGVDYTSTERDQFCPAAGGGDYPSLVWKPNDSQTWQREMWPQGDPQLLHYRTFDVDGDGYPDLLRQPSQAGEALEYGGFARAEVNFTRRLGAHESHASGPGGAIVRGPGVFPFSIEESFVYSVSSHASFQVEVDLNGDGIADLLTAFNGENPEVRLGDGRGGFGCDPAHDVACNVAGVGWLGAAYRLFFPDATSPLPLQHDSPFYFGVPGGSPRSHFVTDVTGDGLADIVAFTPNKLEGGVPTPAKLQLWINVDGRTFRCANAGDCVVATINDSDAPGGITGAGHRAAIVDIDGDGAQDFVLVGERGVWTFPFLVTPVAYATARSPRPGLLIRVDNGIGAQTEIAYETTQVLDRAAAAHQTSFAKAWDTHVPSTTAVVTKITTRDTTTAGGGSPASLFRVNRVRKYEYHNPAYDPWERAFKGFAVVRSIEESTNEVEQQWFYFGACEKGPFIDFACRAGSDGGYDEDCQQVYADKALAGLLVRIDRFIPEAPGQTATKWLSTVTTQYEHRNLFIPQPETGAAPRGRAVSWAAPSVVDSYLYDPTLEVTTVDAVVRPSLPQQAPEQATSKHLRVTTLFDDAGNVKSLTRFGRVDAAGGSHDDKIETRFSPTTNRCHTDWACQPTAVEVVDFPLVENVLQAERPLRRSHLHYDLNADLDDMSAELFTVGQNVPNELERSTTYGVDAPSGVVLAASGGATASTNYVLRKLDRDAFGNVIRVRGRAGSNQSCTEIEFDQTFAQFPAATTGFSGGSCTGTTLTTEQTFDRGLGAVTATRSPSETMQMVDFDAFGRVRAVYAPVPGGGPFATDLSIEVTTQILSPASYVRVRRRVGPERWLESVDIMNGIGESVIGFDNADPVHDGSAWIARSWTERDDAGLPLRYYRPFFTDTDPLSVAYTLAPPPASGNTLLTERDPFGRVVRQHDGPLVVAEYSHLPLEMRAKDAEQAKSSGPFAGLESSIEMDGHGRTVQSIVPSSGDDILVTKTSYLGTGEPTSIRRYGAWTVRTSARWMQWDSYGRMTENHEPNTDGTGLGWRYVYDSENRVVGSSDARRCGKNIHYDALGRVIAEDFSPCLAPPLQAAYTAPNLVTGEGTEAFFRYDNYEDGQVEPTADFDHRDVLSRGRLVSVRDRGSYTRLSYDDRGRVRRVARRLVKPGVPSSDLETRYVDHWYKQDSTFDEGDRLIKRTTGLDEESVLVAGESFETMTYTARGALLEIGGAYGTLVKDLTYTATGMSRAATYGDRAQSTWTRSFDSRERPDLTRFFRAAEPPIWSAAPTATYSTPPAETRLLYLSRVRTTFDDVGNPKTVNDTSPAAWPAGAKPVSRSYDYDWGYRIRQLDYANALDPQTPSFAAEAAAGDRRPVAEAPGATRVQQQVFVHDAHGNVLLSDDDQNAYFDRSFGQQTNGEDWSYNPTGGPHQFIDGSNTHAEYDAAGNMTELKVWRTGCWSEMPNCVHHFLYDWDEMGQLVRARRWDYPDGDVPPLDLEVSPAWDLHYAHGQTGRMLTTKTNDAGETRHTLDVFDTMRIQSVAYDEGFGYSLAEGDQIGFLAGGAARVFFDREQLLPSAGPEETSRLHVYLMAGDGLGSTAFVLDKDSGELVERTEHQAFGKVESDFRPARWAANREAFKFTGKEEDIEVGVTYFGARFYNAHIGRWMSADPLTVHGLAGDPNPYAYVGGRVSAFVDPVGLDCSGSYTFADGSPGGGSGKFSGPGCNEARQVNDRAFDKVLGPLQASLLRWNLRQFEQRIELQRQIRAGFDGATPKRQLRGGTARDPWRWSSFGRGAYNGTLPLLYHPMTPMGLMMAHVPRFAVEPNSNAFGIGEFAPATALLLASPLQRGAASLLNRARASIGARAGLGAGFPGWPTLGERAGGAVGQITRVSCGAACGEMVSGIPQTTLMGTVSQPAAPDLLGAAIGGRGGYVGPQAFGVLNDSGPWIAMMRGDGALHYVVVDGMEGGHVLIRDPWAGGSSYSMTPSAFHESWTGVAVGKF